MATWLEGTALPPRLTKLHVHGLSPDSLGVAVGEAEPAWASLLRAARRGMRVCISKQGCRHEMWNFY